MTHTEGSMKKKDFAGIGVTAILNSLEPMKPTVQANKWEKRCSICGNTKLLNYFNLSGKNYRHTQCNSCRNKLYRKNAKMKIQTLLASERTALLKEIKGIIEGMMEKHIKGYSEINKIIDVKNYTLLDILSVLKEKGK